MNERIKELANQCRYFYESDRGEYQEFDEVKFAELIVQECCDWIDGSPTSESGCQLLLTKQFIIANLKDHFGR